jgi:hypothetical protein
MRWSSADFSGWFRLKGKSSNTFVIVSTQFVFSEFRFEEGCKRSSLALWCAPGRFQRTWRLHFQVTSPNSRE